LLHIFK